MATVQLLMQLQQTKAYSAMGGKVMSTAAESYLAHVKLRTLTCNISVNSCPAPCVCVMCASALQQTGLFMIDHVSCPSLTRMLPHMAQYIVRARLACNRQLLAQPQPQAEAPPCNLQGMTLVHPRPTVQLKCRMRRFLS